MVEGSSIVDELVRLGGLDNREIPSFETALQNRDVDALLPTLDAIQERAGSATAAGDDQTARRLREIGVLLAHYAGLLPPAVIDPAFDQIADGTAGPLAPNLNDIAANGHDYWVVTEICPAFWQCTAEEIADYLARYSVPGSDPSVPVENREFYPVYEPRPWLPRFNPGDVQVFISADGLTVVNRAAKGHWFEGGQVVRTAVRSEDGSWYIITHGFGNNAEYDNVNEWQGPQTFKYMDRQIIADMNSRRA